MASRTTIQQSIDRGLVASLSDARRKQGVRINTYYRIILWSCVRRVSFSVDVP